MSGYTKEYLEEKLRKELDTVHVELEDISDGCGAKFNAVIVSPKFEGKPLLERHRMVNTVLSKELEAIHAFSQKTLTPEQWQAKKA
uniref:BolA-related protein n=1 Tax=Ornithodoros coriaceus TaxID=92741 RepID=B2D2B0_ORNCO|nr:BolA-related protein [Ornithodoros coriaceus]